MLAVNDTNPVGVCALPPDFPEWDDRDPVSSSMGIVTAVDQEVHQRKLFSTRQRVNWVAASGAVVAPIPAAEASVLPPPAPLPAPPLPQLADPWLRRQPGRGLGVAVSCRRRQDSAGSPMGLAVPSAPSPISERPNMNSVAHSIGPPSTPLCRGSHERRTCGFGRSIRRCCRAQCCANR